MVGEMVDKAETKNPVGRPTKVELQFVDVPIIDYSDPVTKYCIENNLWLTKEMTRKELEELYG